jgi:Ca2+-dependent lipid-binding protein
MRVMSERQVVLEMPKAGDTKFKTKVQKKTNNPSFNETFTFPSVKGRYCELLVSVYEKNFMSSDRHVGQVTVGRADVYGSLSVEESFELTSIGGITSGKVVGTVTLKITVT